MAARTLAMIAVGASGALAKTFDPLPSTANCTVNWFNQTIDHFNWGPPARNPPEYTYRQRYYVYDKWWDREHNGPIFFYFGNEDNVGLYVNHTGLMWENAEDFGALLVFAEHRFYGASKPFPDGTAGCMNWLTSEQAMADFATLIDKLREPVAQGGLGAAKSAVIGFGGSYGGMIGSWFRLKYPNSVDGVIAASAPIWSFVGLDPPYDFESFSEGVTYDMSAAGGSAGACVANLRKAWSAIESAAGSAEGRKQLSQGFRTCYEIADVDDALDLVQWAQGPWGNMAMGNYPYPSTYLMHGQSWLPAYPVRAACEHLKDPELSGLALFEGVRAAVATQFNNTGDQKCFYNGDGASSLSTEGGTVPRRVRMRGRKMTDPPRLVHRDEARAHGRRQRGRALQGEANSCDGTWDYQWCTEMVQPFTTGCGGKDFHSPCDRYNYTTSAASCQANWGVTPRELWVRQGLGGKRIQDGSNIVFSNGLMDPWHGGGILKNLSDSILAVTIPNGAHHIDLMFSNPADTPDILAARAVERGQMRKWVQEVADRHARAEL